MKRYKAPEPKPVTISKEMLGPSMCNVTCGHCKNTADLMEFCTTEIQGELPSGQYQCPACKRAWKVEKTPIVVTPWGTIRSEPNRVVPMQSSL